MLIDAKYLRPVTASNNFSSPLHILPTDPNNLAIMSASSSVADPPKLITIECKKIKEHYHFDETINFWHLGKEGNTNKSYKTWRVERYIWQRKKKVSYDHHPIKLSTSL